MELDNDILKLDHDGKYIVGMDINRFPKFLTTPMFNKSCCEHDRYFEEIKDQKVKLVMGIKRRYNNINKYYEAMDIYDSYMDYLLEKYPSMKSIKKAIKCGYMEDYVPPRPILKKTKDNKLLLSSGVRPSKKVFNFDLTNLFNEIKTKDVTLVGNDLEASSKHINKKTREALKYSGSELLKEIRKNSLYSKAYNNPGYDVMKDYYNELLNTNISKTGKTSEKSLTEKILELQEYEEMTDVERRLYELDGYHAENGKFVTNKSTELIELYKTLQEEGFDVQSHLKNSGMKKESIKMIRKKVGGLNQPMTKKELKRFKKRQKKEKIIMENRRKGDAQLTKYLTSNRINALDNDIDSVLDFTFETFYNK